MTEAETVHVPVMFEEVLEQIRAGSGGTFLDCTLGGGGHTEGILRANSANRVVSADRDLRAIERGRRRLEPYGDRVVLHHAPFSRLGEVTRGMKFDGILADLGISTDQLKEGRGFSFSDDAPIDMRMDEGATETGSRIVNEAGERELFAVLKRGGVGSEAKAVASAIVRARPISTAGELAEIVKRAVGWRVAASRTGAKRTNPATVVFQAIRMAVNGEIDELRALLELLPSAAKAGGRAVVISFHSLEDMEVGRTMRFWQHGEGTPAGWRGEAGTPSLGVLLTKKAIAPTAEEVSRNPASRSARMRVFEFGGG